MRLFKVRRQTYSDILLILVAVLLVTDISVTIHLSNQSQINHGKTENLPMEEVEKSSEYKPVIIPYPRRKPRLTVVQKEQFGLRGSKELTATRFFRDETEIQRDFLDEMITLEQKKSLMSKLLSEFKNRRMVFNAKILDVFKSENKYAVIFKHSDDRLIICSYEPDKVSDTIHRNFIKQKDGIEYKGVGIFNDYYFGINLQRCRLRPKPII